MYSNINRIHPKTLLRKQFIDGEFVRWDTVIRCIAAEHYFKIGELHSLYTKDCHLKHLYIHEGTPDLEGSCKNYINILEGFKSLNTFCIRNPVRVDEDFLLSDGTHRLGASLAMNFDNIYYTLEVNKHFVLDKEGVVRLDWYKKYFTDGEVELMIIKYNELIKESN